MQHTTTHSTGWEQPIAALFTQSHLAVALIAWPSGASSGSFTFVNPLFQAFFGGGRESLTGCFIREVWPGGKTEALAQLAETVGKTGTPGLLAEHETHLTERGIARRKHHQWVAQPIMGEAGQLIGVMLQGTDISASVEAVRESKQTQQALAGQEAFTRSVLESNPDCVKLMDTGGRLNYMNTNGLCSLEIDDFCTVEAKHWWELWPAEGQPLVKAAMQQARAGQQARFQAFCPTAKGTPKWWDVLVSPVRDAGGDVTTLISVSRDCTTQKQAEASLKESEAHLRLVMDGVGIGTWGWDLQSTVSVCDDKTRQLFGLTDTGFQGELDKLFAVIDPNDRARVQQALDESVLNGKPYASEFRVRLRDGSVRWLSGKGKIEYDGAGQPRLLRGINYDITDRRQAEEATRESEARFSIMANATPNMVWALNPDGSQQYVNRYLLDYFGVTEAEFMATSYRHRLHPDDRELATAHLLEAIEQRSVFTSEHRLRRHDGTYRWFLVKAAPSFYPNGDLHGYVGSSIDITEQKQAETEIDCLKEQLHLTVENLPTDVYLFDAKGTPLLINKAARNNIRLLLGDDYVPGDDMMTLLRKTAPRIVATHENGDPIDNEKTPTVVALTTGRQPDYVVVKYIHKETGITKWVWNSATPVLDKAGSVRLVIVSNSDITPIKLAEAAIRESERITRQFAEQLELEVAGRTAELTRANLELKRSNEYLQQFAYIASHDLQEPLRKIQSFGNILMTQHRESLSADGRDMLQRMQNSAGRMSHLVKDLLTYSRLTTHRQAFKPVNLNEIVTAVLTDLELSIQQTDAHISVSQLPTLSADPMQMQQLLGNLIGNALKYVLPGVSPRLALTHRQIAASELLISGIDTAKAVSIPEMSKQVRFYHEIGITDNGIGFDEQYTDRIFGMFQRLVGRSQYEGSGMGLAICKRVADNHHGFIVVRSRPGEGSTFMVYLPD